MFVYKMHLLPEYVLVAFMVVEVTVISGIGSFDANAIQFGMDQLLDASSTQLSEFIHWYFWVMHLGQEVVFCALLVSIFVLTSVLISLISVKEKC